MWIAENRRSQRVAVKVIQPEHVPRYQKMQAAITNLHHPNIVNTLDLQLEEESGRCFQLMDLHDCDLHHLVTNCAPNRRLHENLARRYTAQLASGLGYCHAHQLVHCDVKVENVLVDLKTNRVLLCDFGSVTQVGGDDDPAATLSPVVLSTSGSASYLAPELLAGQPLTPAADSWALGVVLSCMVTGRLPWAVAHPSCPAYADWLRQLQGLDPDVTTTSAHSRLSADLRSLLAGLLNPDVDERLTSAEALQHPFLSPPAGSAASTAAATTAAVAKKVVPVVPASSNGPAAPSDLDDSPRPLKRTCC